MSFGLPVVSLLTCVARRENDAVDASLSYLTVIVSRNRIAHPSYPFELLSLSDLVNCIYFHSISSFTPRHEGQRFYAIKRK